MLTNNEISDRAAEPIHLQLCESKDLPALAELADKIWRGYYTELLGLEQIEYMLDKFYSNHALREQIKDGQNFYFIKTGEKAIGFISFSKKAPNTFFIHKFYIDPEDHRRNFGRKVFELIKNMFLKECSNEIFSVSLTVNRQNFKAVNFYFKIGFRIERVEDFDIGNGYFMNDFVMTYFHDMS